MPTKQLTVMDRDPQSYQPIDIEDIEQQYGATYVGDFCIKTQSGWTPMPAAIFYTQAPDKNKGHTHYFALLVIENKLVITKGDSAFEEPIIGLITKDGTVVFSRYIHDFRKTKDSSFIDGGRDYCRYGGGVHDTKLVKLVINKDKLIIDPASIDNTIYSI